MPGWVPQASARHPSDAPSPGPSTGSTSGLASGGGGRCRDQGPPPNVRGCHAWKGRAGAEDGPNGESADSH